MLPPSRSEDEQRAFFETWHEQVRQAVARAGAVTRTIEIGGRRLRLRFAGERLAAPLTAALAPVTIADAPDVADELVIADAATLARCRCPARPARPRRGDLPGFDSPRFRAALHLDQSALCVYRRHVFDLVGLFDSELMYAEDTDFYLRAKERHCKVERLEEVTLHVHRHGASMTKSKSFLELGGLRVVKKGLDRRR
jgi:hypothetical protein